MKAKLKFTRRGENQTKNIERRDLWRELKNLFIGKMQDFRSRKFKYGNAELIKSYIENVKNINIPKENEFKILKEQAKKFGGIKLNLSKSKLREAVQNAERAEQEKLNTPDYDLIKSNDINGILNLLNNHQRIPKNLFSHCLEIFKNLTNKGKYILEFILQQENGTTTNKNIFITNNEKFNNLIKELLTGTIEEKNKFGSDYWTELKFNMIKSVKLTKYEKPEKYIKNKTVNYFNLVNTYIKINLERYQIFTEEQLANKDPKKEIENCLIHSLRLSNQFTETELNELKLSIINGAYIPKKNFTEICEKLNCSFIIHYFTNKQIKKYRYGKNENKIINMGIVNEHIFIVENMDFNCYSLERYEELNERFPEPKTFEFKFNKFDNDIYSIRKNHNNKMATSIETIHYMFINNKFIFSNHLNKLTESVKTNNRIILNNEIMENEQRIIEKRTPDAEKLIFNFYADFETDTSKGYHIPILGGIIGESQTEPTIFLNQTPDDKTVIDGILNYITNSIPRSYNKNNIKINCYFHNLKYDMNVLIRYQHLSLLNVVEKGGNIYSLDISHYGYKITLKDSYKIIPFPLKAFQSTLKLPEELNKKENINYNAYTFANFEDLTNYKINEYCKKFTEENKIAFKEDIKNLNFVIENPIITTITPKRKKTKHIQEPATRFNALEYYKYYLKYDCLVLKAGINKMRDLIFNLSPEIDIHNFLTISSICHRYMEINGAYDEIYQVSGNTKRFLANAVMGGRCHVNEKYQHQIITEKLAYNDATSLYPSAMLRLLLDNLGFPKGKAKFIENSTYEQIKNFDYYVVEIRINKVNKFQQMPFIMEKDEEGTSRYTNTPSNNILYVDKLTLEDWIKFHQIDFTTYRVVYYDEGYNPKIGQIIQTLFNLRLQAKREKNGAMSELIKLMMNSAYGKTILKSENSKSKIVKINSYVKNEFGTWELKEKQNLNKFIYENFNIIKNYVKINDNNYLFNTYERDTSFNYSHCGAIILSMSKRIMNEVFDICNDEEIKIYYTDTDSLILEYNKIPILSRKYKELYNKEYIGNNLLEFHGDFKLYNKGKAIDDVENIYSYESYFYDKKVYCCNIGYDTPEGVITGEQYRVKGFTQNGVDAYIAQNYRGKAIDFFNALTEKEHKIQLITKDKFAVKIINFQGVETNYSLDRTIGGKIKLKGYARRSTA